MKKTTTTTTQGNTSMEQGDEPARDAPAFDFYCERWSHGTRLMTKVERCDYLDLLLHQWTSDGLPADLDLVARLVGYRKGSQISPLVLEKFPIAEDGKRRNARLEMERVKQRVRIRAKRGAAALANAKIREKKIRDGGGGGGLPHAATDGPGHVNDMPERNGIVTHREHTTSSERNVIVTHNERTTSPERNVIVTPPPTTHHPPRSNTHQHTHLAGAREEEEQQDNEAHEPERNPDDAGVEFPTWFPPTEEGAVATCATFAVPAEYVRSVWLQLVGREFKDGAGREVVRFGHYVASRWPKEKARWERDQCGSAAPRAGGRAPEREGRRSAIREERGQRQGEIPTDVKVDKIKVYRMEDCDGDDE
jgi:uncharacterized protein YdaU (DUF1376 family)